MRIVRTRSIPNVPDDRLITDMGRIHDMIHTIDGIRGHDGTRRSMIDLGRKGKKIAAAIRDRDIDHPHPDCTFCAAPQGGTP